MFVSRVAKYVAEYLMGILSSYRRNGRGKVEKQEAATHSWTDQREITYKGCQVLNDGDILVFCSQYDVFIARHDRKHDGLEYDRIEGDTGSSRANESQYGGKKVRHSRDAELWCNILR